MSEHSVGERGFDACDGQDELGQRAPLRYQLGGDLLAGFQLAHGCGFAIHVCFLG